MFLTQALIQVPFFQKLKKSLEGKKIVKYDLILDTAYNTLPDTHLILYFTGSDCSSCIQKAIAAIEHKNMINNHLFIVPISYQSNIGNIQMSYDYPYMIYDDNSNTIRGSLQYISTPVFIKYSIKDGIQDIYVIPTFDDNGKLSDFIESLG